jgi:hypothetical protein
MPLMNHHISDIIAKLSKDPSSYDITLYPPASALDLSAFERELNCPLPDDLKTLYLFCIGFESAEDLFRIIPLDEIRDRMKEYQPNQSQTNTGFQTMVSTFVCLPLPWANF